MATAKEYKISQRPLCHTEIAQEPHDFLTPINGYAKMPWVSLEKAVEKLFDFLPGIQYYVSIAQQNYRYPGDGLTKDESTSIMLYPMSWEPCEECLYFVLNTTLRSPDRQKLKPWLLYLRLLLNGLFRLPPVSRTIYRDIKFDLSEAYLDGKTIIWWGFSSCTRALNMLQLEQFLRKTGIRTMFVIECYSGRDISKHSFFPSEKEVLLLPATQFKVAAGLDQNDLHIINLEEIQPTEPLLRPLSAVPALHDVFLSIPMVSESHSIPSTPKTPLVGRSKSSATKAPVISPQYQNSALEENIVVNRYFPKLDLKSMELTDQGMKIVASDAIRNTTTLAILNLEKNKIGAQGVQYLSEQLKYNKTITTLSLRCNQIGDKGTHHLSAVLRQTTQSTWSIRN